MTTRSATRRKPDIVNHLKPMLIRPTTLDDIAALAAIYRHHVLHSTGSFEIEPPDADEMTRRWQAVSAQGMPHLVLSDADTLLGFAYAQPFRPRLAYRYTLEDSIYLHPQAMGQGLGRVLLAELIARAERLGARQMVAVIGDSANHGSIGLHRALGFVAAGQLHASGFKHGRWLDTVFMQRPLGAGDHCPPGP
jgi:L-amino acid N-acyltransferase YncA